MFNFLKMERRLPTPEEWAQRHKDVTTPDRIIAEAIASSLRKHFDDWESGGFEICFEPRPHYFNDRHIPRLYNAKKEVKVIFGHKITLRNFFMSYNNYMMVPRLRGTTVNGVNIDATSAEIIWNAYHKAKKVHEAAKKVSTFALEDMRRNEMAWNLVEKLLNMTRNDQGALVPIVDHNGDKVKLCTDCHNKAKMCRKHQMKSNMEKAA